MAVSIITTVPGQNCNSIGAGAMALGTHDAGLQQWKAIIASPRRKSRNRWSKKCDECDHASAGIDFVAL